MKTILGNSIEKLKDLEDNSVDAIITDPPYALGFMGKEWDTFDNTQFGQKGLEGENDLKVKKNFNILPRYNAKESGFQEFCYKWATECLRVLKPGGHLLAFGGTRTYHRMAVAIEDAGFEVRDMLEWIYACLSEDTEILTIDGWKQYNKSIVNNLVLCYNVDKGTFEFHKPTNYFIYENQHTAYRIQSDNTDQIVSRNHRVVVERDGKFVFQTAETLQRQENIPFLESLQSLPEAIHDFQSHASVEKRDLLARVQEQDISKKTETTSQSFSRKTLRGLRQAIQNKKGEAREVLLNSMQRKNKGNNSFGTQQEKSAKVDRGTQTEGQRENDGRTELGVERWSNIFQKARKLLADKICKVSARVFGNGTEGRLCYGASSIYGTETGSLPPKSGSGASHQSQSAGQQNRKSDVIPEQSGTQITRSTITPIEYKGKMWCVEVPTSAFVARRNGKIFITGNSGFPKSLNVGKAVDKLQGNEREVLGKSDNGIAGGSGEFTQGNPKSARFKAEFDITKGNSEWEGFGTALKPAHEPIILCRKPLSEKTIVENVLKHGTGAIDIDGTRIPTGETTKSEGHFRKGNVIGDNRTSVAAGQFGDGAWVAGTDLSQGRFPANIICTDDALNDGVMTRERIIKKSGGDYSFTVGKANGKRFQNQTEGQSGSKSRYFDIDVWGEKYGLLQFPKAAGKERWSYCSICGKCFVSRDITVEKVLSARLKIKYKNLHLHDRYKDGKEDYSHIVSHPTLKPLSVMSWLVRLVSKEGDTVLDPFMGSGTTGVACKKLGRHFIGIEREEEYIKIAEARMGAVKDMQMELL